MNIETPTLAEYIRSVLVCAGYSEHHPRSERGGGFIITPGPNRAAGVRIAGADGSADPRNLLLAQYANRLQQSGLDVTDLGDCLVVTRREGTDR